MLGLRKGGRRHGGRRYGGRRYGRGGGSHTGAAHTLLPTGAAGGATVAGAGAIRILWTTNGLSTTGTGRATGVAQAFAMGGIRGALLFGWRILAKDGLAEAGAGA